MTFRAGEDLEGVLAVRQEAGEVENYTTYALFNVTHPANWSLENVTISFRVSKEWLDGKNGTLVLLRYSGRKWEKYEPIYEYSDREYSYYRARVQGLSLFAVAEKIEVPTPPSPGTNETTETKPTTETTTTPNPTETPSSSPSPPNTESGSNLPYYALGIAVLILVGAYIYRKR
ncbi:PGF-pre-PGF domain-containing protein [Thermococcus stetteri]|uniref:PGF-pre-PGF domain-containing protein n=1 Tax=Thermococcus stetteri TaxID=49900 RepID=UPI001AE6E67B|nr:hypothetical protein [Thermococcus stetteri]